MDFSESRNLIILLLVAGALILASRVGLFSPGGVKDAQEKIVQFWADYGRIILACLVAIIALLLLFAAYQAYSRWAMQNAIRERVAGGPTVQLLPRADAKPVQPERLQIWDRLAEALPHDEHISFELIGNEDSIGFYLHGSGDGITAAQTQFRAEWPGIFRKSCERDPALPDEGWKIWWVELAPTAYDISLRAAADDPLRAVLIETAGVVGHGRAMMQIVARRNFGARKLLGQKAFSARDDETPSKGVRAIRQDEARLYEERARTTFLDVSVRAVGVADTAERAQSIARSLSRAISAQFSSSGGVSVQPVRQGNDPACVVGRHLTPSATPWAAHDLAYLAHLSGSDLMQVAPRLASAPARYLPADPDMRLNPAAHKTAFLVGETK